VVGSVMVPRRIVVALGDTKASPPLSELAPGVRILGGSRVRLFKINRRKAAGFLPFGTSDKIALLLCRGAYATRFGEAFSVHLGQDLRRGRPVFGLCTNIGHP
jgi:hypothetical protein